MTRGDSHFLFELDAKESACPTLIRSKYNYLCTADSFMWEVIFLWEQNT